MSSQNALEVYEFAITNGKRLCKELASFEAQSPLPASLASCGYKVQSGSLGSNVMNSLRTMPLSCGILISNSTYVEVRSADTPETMIPLKVTGLTQSRRHTLGTRWFGHRRCSGNVGRARVGSWEAGFRSACNCPSENHQ
ncbi:hypothetical protein T440DRAFT_483145 [Plenodomus tracheiphilus IPT5]|uniref:Uncharacterized protein n=1 Tax=Plenodomus tracheiphilus IPT5 TaxID=1408161 RepID=A0A6A7AUK3_9PLEO|nr:hypothetical protein T440DRAFT_483145 [Plenodomus tracheiphilus IPT5]